MSADNLRGIDARCGPDALPRYLITMLHVWPGQPVSGHIVNPRPLGIMTHWIDGRTRPHFRDESQCEGCRLYNAKRWSGFLAVQVGQDARYGCIRYTGFAAQADPRLLPARAEDLRGLPFTAGRIGKSPTSPVRLKIPVQYAARQEVRQEVRLLEWLLHLWDLSSAEPLEITRDGGEVDPGDVIG